MPQRIWRSHCPIEVREMQRKVLDATVHLLMIRQNGPTAFTILDENDKLTYQVYLGDPHKCSCKYFQRINELCAHICWVLLKKMQLDPKDPLSFQLGMLPREITDCLQPQFIARPRQKKIDFRKLLNNKDERNLPYVKRRAIRSGDSCPVCLELFEQDDKHQNITYCRHGCGNCIHVRCMELIAKHQLESYNECLQIICPLCRGDFGTMSELRSVKYSSSPIRRPVERKVARHTAYNCCSCDVSPVLGNLYRCLQCTQVTFCNACVNSATSTAVYHEGHGFAIKINEGDRWKPLPQFWRRKREEVARRKLPPLLRNSHMKAIDIRKQKAVARWVEDGYSGYSFSQPPEVRVSRISLEERRQRVPPPPHGVPPAPGLAAPACHQPPLPVTTSRKASRKRRQRSSRNNDNDANRLPAAVSEGRALGVQVQPLMAVLMSPRPSNECSPQNILDTESEETNYTDGESAMARRSGGGGPQLSVTSLELPDWSLHRLPSRPLPLRPAFRSAGRPFLRTASSHQSSRSLALDCSKMSLSSRLQRAAI